MADPPIEAALPLPGLVANLLCDDQSLVLSNPKGNITVIRARPLTVFASADVTADRVLGATYTNDSDKLRFIQAALTVTSGLSVITTTLINYTTVTGDLILNNIEVGEVTNGGASQVTDQAATFYCSPGGTYSINATLSGSGQDSVAVSSWTEVDLF
jgi:hypothetical protein